MNNLYFACPQCKVFIDAGYRWAFATLESPNIVTPGQPVVLSRVLSANEYWNPPKDSESDWLHKQVLPSVRQFLDSHQSHTILFGDMEDIPLPGYDEKRLDWLQLGASDMNFLPRYYVEILEYTDWEQVVKHVKTLKYKPWWNEPCWSEAVPEDLTEKAHQKFDELVNSSITS